MSLIAVTTSQGLSVISSFALHPSTPNPAPLFTTALTPPSRIPSSCISWSKDASIVFVASGGSVSAYDPTSGAWLRDVVREGEGGIGGAKLSSMAVLDGVAPGPTLAFARGSRAVVFNSEARRAVQSIEGHKSAIFAMSLSCDQSLLATSSAETTMITNLAQESTTVLRGTPAGMTAAAFHPSRPTTLLVLSPKGLHVFDTTKGGAPIRTIPITKAEGGNSGSITFSPVSPALVAVALPTGGRVLLLDIDKDASLLKKFTLDENVASIVFSHDGSAIITATETGRVWQLNLRSTDNPATMVTVDASGGKIGGLALISESPVTKATFSLVAALVTKAPVHSIRTESTASSTGSVRNKSSTMNLRGTLRTRPSIIETGAKSQESPSVTSPETMRNKSPQVLRNRSSTIDLAKRPSTADLRANPSVTDLGRKSSTADLRSKVSPGGLRVKPGVESKVRPTSMISPIGGRERASVRVRPVSRGGEKTDTEDETKSASQGRDTISRGTRPSAIDLKRGAATPSPGSKFSGSGSGSPPTSGKESSPTLRRQTQTMTMPRRLTSENSRPTLTQIFAQDDAVPTRSRSSSQSNPPLASTLSQTSVSSSSQGSGTPLTARAPLSTTTPNYPPGASGPDSATDYEPEDRVLVPRIAERERPWSRLGEERERARSRLGSETPRLPTIEDLPSRASQILDDRPRSRVGDERPRSRAFVDGSESERERPSSRLFKDDLVDRPASRGALGLGRPTGLARRFSSDLKVTPETMRVISDAGIIRGRVEEEVRPQSSLRERSLRERPSSILRDRPDSVFREPSDSAARDRLDLGIRERATTPLSASSLRGKRVGWVDKESPYVSAPLDTVFTPARTRSGLAASTSGSGSISSDDSDCAHRGTNAVLVTPRRGLAAALGAEVYVGDAPPHKSNGSITKTQAQDMLRNIVSDVMFEFRQEAKDDVRGLHLDLLRASRGWKSDLKEYLGDTLEELRLVKEENAQLRAEIARLRRGY